MPSVVLVLIDGMRPDALQHADTPTMDRLIASGAHTMTARTVMPSITLPVHASLFLGVMPDRHGNTTNTWTPPARPIPGLIDLVHQTGGKTAAFYNWEQLRDVSRPGSLDASFFIKDTHSPNGDTMIAHLASAWLTHNQPALTFIYFGHTDQAGHDHGWMSQPYLNAIANADRCIAMIVNALPADATLIVTSDHGGHAQTHGTDSDEDMTIPFIISGPSIPSAHRIQSSLHVTDVAPTIAHLLGLDSPAEWTGTSISLNHHETKH